MDGYIRKDLEDRQQSVSAKNGNTSNLFTHLCNHHTRLHVETVSLHGQAEIIRRLVTIVNVLM